MQSNGHIAGVSVLGDVRQGLPQHTIQRDALRVGLQLDVPQDDDLDGHTFATVGSLSDFVTAKLAG